MNWLRTFYQDSIPCSEYDVPAVEEWLEHQARQGRVLVSWLSFRSGVPADFRFTLVPALRGEKEPSEEKKAVYAAAGWEYVCRTSGTAFFVWRSGAADPAPLQTDPSADSWAYDCVWKKMIIRSSLLALYSIVMALQIFRFFFFRHHPLLNLAQDRQAAPLLAYLIFLILFLFVYQLTDIRILRRLIHSLRSGVPLPPHRKPRFPRRAAVLVFTLIILIYSGTSLFGLLDNHMAVNYASDPTPFLAAQTLGGSSQPGMVRRESTVMGQAVTVRSGAADMLCREAVRSRKLLRVVYSTQQEVYHLRFFFLSQPLLREIVRAYIPEDGGAAVSPMETPLFDEAFYGTANGVQHFAARLENQVLYYRTDAPQDLRKHLPELAAILTAPEARLSERSAP